jgi:indolepyruvate ferredoxin oxidoreductase
MQTQEAALALETGYRLEDNRTARAGRVFLTGTQALVRLLFRQQQEDKARGWNTAGYVSGYRGSPLAGVDTELWRAKSDLAEHGIRFLPAINEDLAATAVMGTQQVGLDPEREVDGVFAMWYGKGPGVDRAGDAIRHGNAAGTSRRGGVLMVVGDDHAATSSSIPNASDLSLMGWGIPIVHPASVDEYEAFGLWGWAASRHASTWVAFKAISETVESARSVDASIDAAFALPEPSELADTSALEYRTSDFLTAAVEIRLAAKLEAFSAFARGNPLDRLVVAAPEATTGIVAVGKSFHDLMEVLQRCGFGADDLPALGLRLYKPGLVFPLDNEGADRFCEGLSHVLVIEEKASVVEQQLKDRVFNRARRPTVCGKQDLEGHPLLAWTGQLSPASIAAALLTWLRAIGHPLAARIDTARFAPRAALSNEADGMRRLPYFCSGCPHNSSTKVPEGSQAQAGVGCHYMASWMDRDTGGLTQMGGEGADWLGRGAFTRVPHVFQNMGEGTYFHSGYLAIRQAVAGGANITYKILFNDAVAMTGGQPVDGQTSVPQICTQVASEGARKVVVVTDEPQRYQGVTLAAGVQVRHRRELDMVQRELREISGVTVLVYDQTCAAEKRRRRKRKSYPDPARRVLINPEVCEGCGDCGTQSNCLSVAPLETSFGRKRQIDQSSCNKDFSCAEGFCPSFVSVLGGSLRKGTVAAPAQDPEALAAALAPPALPSLAHPFDLMIAGVGGTGVITLGALIAMAAHLEGKGVSVLDFTALAQKGGSVVSHVRLADTPDRLHAVRLLPGTARTLIAADLVVGVLPDVLGVIGEGRTRVVVNMHLQTLAEFTRQPDLPYREDALLAKIEAAAGVAQVERIDANATAKALLGDAIGANMLMLGHAWQQGGVPVSLAALMRAIELNGVAVAANKRAFAAGRLTAADPQWRQTLMGDRRSVVTLNLPQSFEKLLEERVRFLTDYQNARYARRYLDTVRRVEAAERGIAPGARRPRLADAVARSLFKLMAYKDEYEVARLHARPEFLQNLRSQFEGNFKLQFHLAPPIFEKRGADGKVLKRSFGAWMLPVFRGLAAMRGLRGTPIDPFGWLAERREERALLVEYEGLVERLLDGLTNERIGSAVAVAALPEKIRGYGHVKARAIAEYRRNLATLLAAHDAPPPAVQSPALKTA